MKKLNKTYYKIHCLKYIQLTSISCFPPNVIFFFYTFDSVDKFANFDHPYHISVKISDILVSLIVLMKSLTIRVTSVHMAAICAQKQQYVPRLKI